MPQHMFVDILHLHNTNILHALLCSIVVLQFFGRRNNMSSDNVSRILKDCEAAIRKDNPELIHLHSHLFRNPNFNKIQTSHWNSA